MNVYLKRAKIFLVYSEDTGEQRFAAGPTNSQPVVAPDWIKETTTYKLGLKDGSIVDLTPPYAPVVTDSDLPIPEKVEPNLGLQSGIVTGKRK